MAHAEGLAAATIAVDVAYCPRPGVADLTTLQLPAGATVAEALQASGVLERHRIELAQARVGIWCKAATLQAPLRDRDRVELYRRLTVDPKEARRQRYQRHRAKTAAGR